MARVVRIHKTGGPEVLTLEDVEVGEPGAGEIRVRIEAICSVRAYRASRQESACA